MKYHINNYEQLNHVPISIKIQLKIPPLLVFEPRTFTPNRDMENVLNQGSKVGSVTLCTSIRFLVELGTINIHS